MVWASQERTKSEAIKSCRPRTKRQITPDCAGLNENCVDDAHLPIWRQEVDLTALCKHRWEPVQTENWSAIQFAISIAEVAAGEGALPTRRQRSL